MNQITKQATQPQHVTPTFAAELKSCLMHLQSSPPNTMQEYTATKTKVDLLRTPAPKKWILARVNTLLAHYYQAKGDDVVAKAMMKDWVNILGEYPAWAISNACRSWLSSPKAAFKPIPGQVVEIINREMVFIKNIEVGLQRVVDQGLFGKIQSAPPEKPSEPLTEEQKERRDQLISKLVGSLHASNDKANARQELADKEEAISRAARRREILEASKQKKDSVEKDLEK